MTKSILNETHPLQEVIVHTPGREVSLLNPEIKDDLLFDDIIFEEDAREEHLEMLEIFKTAMPEAGIIYEIADLMKECLDQEDARGYLIQRFEKMLSGENLSLVKDRLINMNGSQLTRFLVEGQSEELPHFNIAPIPNLLFTRDLAAVVGSSIILSQAAKSARVRESLMMETLLMHHPLFEDFNDQIIRVGSGESIEGGDILVASEKVVMIGMSERSSFSGILKVAEGLFEEGVERVVIVDIPKQRSSMHLDTIFTFASPDECVVFPPAIIERRHNVVVLSKSGDQTVAKTWPSVKEALDKLLERDLTFIKCGGEDRTNQYREQWTDGANVVALAPGLIVGYERNKNTFQALKEHGYTIMEQHDFIDTYRDRTFVPGEEKVAVTFGGHELCRGRGGARCMTLPLNRISEKT